MKHYSQRSHLLFLPFTYAWQALTWLFCLVQRASSPNQQWGTELWLHRGHSRQEHWEHEECGLAALATIISLCQKGQSVNRTRSENKKLTIWTLKNIGLNFKQISWSLPQSLQCLTVLDTPPTSHTRTVYTLSHKCFHTVTLLGFEINAVLVTLL